MNDQLVAVLVPEPVLVRLIAAHRHARLTGEPSNATSILAALMTQAADRLEKLAPDHPGPAAHCAYCGATYPATSAGLSCDAELLPTLGQCGGEIQTKPTKPFQL